ncbi:hypothetical protein [Ulvibacter sp. MAR_2010_11]|uniref:hypothetical protein n=1 Tax=Ulvibacter sp. MAR_2010_11 TaxID=1250229 RepID=UPI001E390B11|nr:hypothetical protein [Ulvibacter sp. MAR_2010_11]
MENFKITQNISDLFTKNNTQESIANGSIYRKTFLFFRKKIGNYSSTVTHKDTVILTIAKSKKYNDKSKTVNENYFFDNNELSKYTRLVDTGKDSVQISKLYKQILNDKIVIKSNKTIHGESELQAQNRFDQIKKNIERELNYYVSFIETSRIAY